MKTLNKSVNPIPILIGLTLLLIGVAQITALWILGRVIILPTAIKSSSIEELQSAKFSPQIYQLSIVDHRIHLTPRTIDTKVDSPQLALQEAVNKLLTQSPAFDSTTTIPAETRLLDLQINPDSIYVDLSQEFTKGGNSSSMIYRVAQILYTATSLEPQKSVYLSIEGQPVNHDYPLGDHKTSSHLGLFLDSPLTRQQFNRDFLVE